MLPLCVWFIYTTSVIYTIDFTQLCMFIHVYKPFLTENKKLFRVVTPKKED